MTVVAFVVFSLLYFTPGDPAAVLAGDAATTQDIQRIREKLGLDEPFLVRFSSWMWAVARGDLGTSIFTNLPVTRLIGQRVEPTLALAGCTLLVAVSIAVPLGVAAAARAGTWVDRAVMAFSVLGFSLPVFVLAYSLILAFSIQLDVLAQDYVRTARAKGLAPAVVLGQHALKNAAVPVVTIIGVGIALLVSGAIVTETVFAIPGIGRLTVDAILRRDYPIIQGVTLIFSGAYVLINLAVDLSYVLLDPRIRY